MEKTVETRPPAAFRFRFSPVMLTLCVLGIVLSLVGFGLTTWQFFGFVQSGDMTSFYEWLKYILLYLASGALGVLIVAMLIRSRYLITDTKLILQFGLIKQKYELKKIVSVHLFRGARRLAVYFDDFKTDYVIIVVKEERFDDFVRELTARNQDILFTFSTPEEEAEVKKKK